MTRMIFDPEFFHNQIRYARTGPNFISYRISTQECRFSSTTDAALRVVLPTSLPLLNALQRVDGPLAGFEVIPEAQYDSGIHVVRDAVRHRVQSQFRNIAE